MMSFIAFMYPYPFLLSNVHHLISVEPGRGVEYATLIEPQSVGFSSNT